MSSTPQVDSGLSSFPFLHRITVHFISFRGETHLHGVSYAASERARDDRGAREDQTSKVRSRCRIGSWHGTTPSLHLDMRVAADIDACIIHTIFPSILRWSVTYLARGGGGGDTARQKVKAEGESSRPGTPALALVAHQQIDRHHWARVQRCWKFGGHRGPPDPPFVHLHRDGNCPPRCQSGQVDRREEKRQSI